MTVTETKRKGCTQKEDITSARRITNVSTKTIKEQDIFLLRKILIVMHHPKVIIFNNSCWNYFLYFLLASAVVYASFSILN